MSSDAAAKRNTPGDDDLGIAVPARGRRRQRRRQLEDSYVDMTPMIDVTFQLLIFFMFTNQMVNPSPVDAPQAVHGLGVSPDGKQMILVDDEAHYFLGTEATAPMALGDLIKTVQGNARATPDPLDVIISAHKNSHYQDVRKVVEELGTLTNIGAIRIGVEEKQ